MKPFSLNNVLAYRKRLEDIAQNRFFEARKVHQLIEQKHAEEKGILCELTDRSEHLQSEGVNITELIRYEERILQVKTNLLAIAKNLAEKAEILKREHQNLINRARERQIMERLKERQDRAWAAYLDKKETSMLDEIAILRHESENH